MKYRAFKTMSIFQDTLYHICRYFDKEKLLGPWSSRCRINFLKKNKIVRDLIKRSPITHKVIDLL